jgi:beta-lactamase superfamily II metal-dependent hydrolase
MVEIDFLSGSESDPDSTSSYDAIVARFQEAQDDEQKVIVVDAGFSDIGNDVVNFLDETYGTNKVDLMISTHPDQDHLNGLITAIQQLEVTELLIHQPGNYRDDLSGFTNLDNLNTLLAFAEDRGTVVSDPYTGLSRFGGRLLVLGPTEDYYKECLAAQFDPEVQAQFARRSTPLTSILGALERAADRVLAHLPVETLGDDGKTHPRNNSSVVTLLTVDGYRHMLTGDAGIPALEQAADFYEINRGSFSQVPLCTFQMPHHGSKRNVGKTILNRIIGEHGQPHNANMRVHISAVKASKKHPSSKVTNAAMRRGVQPGGIAVTNGTSFRHAHDAPERENYSPIAPYPILAED